MNTAHGMITSMGDRYLGFDIAITEPGVLPITADCTALGHWCMGEVPMLMRSLTPSAPGQWEDSFDVHVRLVLVDENLPDAHTAGHNNHGDNVRFASLPGSDSRVVNVDVIVTEQ